MSWSRTTTTGRQRSRRHGSVACTEAHLAGFWIKLPFRACAIGADPRSRPPGLHVRQISVDALDEHAAALGCWLRLAATQQCRSASAAADLRCRRGVLLPPAAASAPCGRSPARSRRPKSARPWHDRPICHLFARQRMITQLTLGRGSFAVGRARRSAFRSEHASSQAQGKRLIELDFASYYSRQSPHAPGYKPQHITLRQFVKRASPASAHNPDIG